MTNKLEYLSPETEIWPVQLEGPLCASGDVPDYTVVEGFVWDDFDLL